MRFTSRAAAAAFASLVLAPSPAPAQSDTAAATGLSLYAETRLVSRYLWRGYDLSNGKPAIQPYAEAWLPFGLGVNAFATTALDSHVDLDEAQLSLLYKRDVGGGFEVSGGYLLYIMPGTETEPSDDPDPMSVTTSGEFTLALTRNWENGYATLTYSRGMGLGEGNSLNFWAQRTFTWGNERWTAEPYVQADYLDEYGAPSGLGQRMSLVEVGVPVYYQLGPVSLVASGHLSYIPSSYVRSENASGNRLLPWLSIGLVYERD